MRNVRISRRRLWAALLPGHFWRAFWRAALALTVICALSGCGGTSSQDKAKAQQQSKTPPSVIDQELNKQYKMYKEMRRYQLEEQMKVEQDAAKKKKQSEKSSNGKTGSGGTTKEQ